VERDLATYLPKLSPGGLLVIDDLSWASVHEALEQRGDDVELIYRLYASGSDDFGVFRLRA
jgi:predicted O-methyltransferase YrrM